LQLLKPSGFSDYELIDSGAFEKLERFGEYITIRPEPQALWDKQLPERDWEKMAHVRFVPKSSSSGTWEKLKAMPDRWVVGYKKGKVNIKLRLALTSFKQALYIFKNLRSNHVCLIHTIGINRACPFGRFSFQSYPPSSLSVVWATEPSVLMTSWMGKFLWTAHEEGAAHYGTC
jgi:hypothetical protein